MTHEEEQAWLVALNERDEARAEVARLEGVVIRLAHEKDEAVERYAALQDEVLNLSRQLADLRGARPPRDRT